MTAKKTMRIEFLYAGGCDNCAKARDELREAAQSTAQVHWEEVDIAKQPHRAADLGVVSTPAVAIGGKLVFKSLPTVSALRKAIAASVRPR